MRQAARRDVVEREVIVTLEMIGFQVEPLSQTDFPDLLMSRAGRWYVAECKTQPELGKRGKGYKDGQLRPGQRKFKDRARAPVPILRSAKDVIAWNTSLVLDSETAAERIRHANRRAGTPQEDRPAAAACRRATAVRRRQ